MAAGEGDFIELTPREQDLFRRMLQDFANRAAERLRQQGVDPRVIVVAFGAALAEMFGPGVQIGWQEDGSDGGDA